MRCVLLLPLVLLAAGCATAQPAGPPGAVVTTTPARVVTGAERLVRGGFAELRGMRVGLIANHTTTANGRHLADLLHDAPGVRLTALFGPEHGLRGDADAGDRIADGRDARTGTPVYSIYGRHRAPTDSMLADVDVLVFDIQDVGARFYTYISTMGLSMQAAARRGIPFVVLDRPNPLGGLYAGGFVLEPAQTSFVGQFAIPQAHGLTVGELARAIKGLRLLPGLERLDLRVVTMEGWRRADRWPQTGLPWVPTSPNVPDIETALLYAGTCLIEGTSASEGRGTRRPFKRVGDVGIDPERLAADLNARRLPGVRFTPVRFTPVAIVGMSAEPKRKDTPVAGVDVEVTDAAAVQPVELGVHLLDAFLAQAPDRAAFFARPEFFDRLAGTPRLRTMLTAGRRPAAVAAAWAAELRRFEARTRPYRLYP